MLRMLREKTQRRLCRVLFFAGCLAPTLAVAALVADRLSGGERERVLAAIGKRLNATVDCDRFATPRRGVYELTGVRLAANDSAEPIARCDRLRVASTGGAWRFAAGEVSVSSPAIGSAGWRQLATDVRGSIERLSLADAAWERLTATIEPDALTLAAADRPLISWTPDAIALDTAGQSMPLAWLPLAPLAGIELDATFAGSASLAEGRGDAEGVLHLNTDRLSGFSADRGRVTDLHCQWRGDEFTELSGRVELRDGGLPPTLVYGVNEWLGMPATPAMQAAYTAAAGGAIPFTQVAFEAQLDSEGLTLVGRCDEIDGVARGGAIAHAVVEHLGEPLLLEPPVRPLPAPRLLRALWPDAPAEREIPAMRGAIDVARRLPMGDTTIR